MSSTALWSNFNSSQWSSSKQPKALVVPIINASTWCSSSSNPINSNCFVFLSCKQHIQKRCVFSIFWLHFPFGQLRHLCNKPFHFNSNQSMSAKKKKVQESHSICFSGFFCSVLKSQPRSSQATITLMLSPESKPSTQITIGFPRLHVTPWNYEVDSKSALQLGFQRCTI